MLETTLHRNWRAISSPRGFHLFIGGVLALCFLLRILLMPGGSQDDSELLILSQSFEGLYKPGQPPLLNWIAAALAAVFGPSLLLVVLLKFVLLAATYALLYRAARLVLSDVNNAALAAASPLGLYLVSWDALLNYSHTVLMLASVAAALYLALRLRAEGRLFDYLALGLALGIGILGKYNFLIFAGGLLVAALSDAQARTRLADKRIAATAGVALALVVPHLLWLLARREQVAAAFKTSFQQGAETSWFDGVLSGLGALGDGIIGFLLPLGAIVIVAFPRLLRAVRGGTEAARANERFLLLLMAAMLAILVAAVLVAGVSHFRNHYFFVFIVFPLWVFVRLERADPKPAALKRYAGVLTVLAAVIVLAVAGKALFDPLRCRKCYYHVPYAELASQIRAAGFERGTILSLNRFITLGGNLRGAFPAARVISTKFRDYVPPAGATSGSCLLVWNAEARAEEVASLRAYAAQRLGALIPEGQPIGRAEAGLAMRGSRSFALSYLLLPGGSAGCR